MTKKKTMKNIKTPNKFNWGGELLEAFKNNIGSFSGAEFGKNLAGAAPGIVGGITEGVSSAISNGFSTKGGQILDAAGDIAGLIPGPWGMAIKGALELGSGIVNRGFGTQWNNTALTSAKNNIQGLNSFVSGASDYDALANEMSNVLSMNKTYKASDFGKDGWWVDKTKAKAKEMNTKTQNAFNHAMASINNTADNIAADTLANLERNYAALGGLLNRTHGADFTNGLMFINNGGTHESNPYEGVPISMDQEGNPNLVEEGEVIWNDYVFSNRLKVPKSIQKKYKLGKREMTFANAVDKLSKESEERPNDPISIKGLENTLMNMAIEQENIKNKKNINKKGNKFLYGGSPSMQDIIGLNLSPYSNNGKTYNIPQSILDIASKIDLSSIKNTNENNTESISNLPTWMRYAPVFGNAALTFTDALGITNKPDYSNANAIIDESRKTSTYTPVGFKPIGDYMKYNPFDTEYYANQLRAQAGATRRNIMNTSGGNRATAMAGLLSADYNANNSLGDLYRKANEYNLEQRQKVADFNRTTNITNSEGLLKAAMANQSASAQAKALGLEGLMTGYKMKEQANLTADKAKAHNISGLLTNLGNIGYENANRNMMYWGIANGVWAPSQWEYDPLTGKKIKSKE